MVLGITNLKLLANMQNPSALVSGVVVGVVGEYPPKNKKHMLPHFVARKTMEMNVKFSLRKESCEALFSSFFFVEQKIHLKSG